MEQDSSVDDSSKDKVADQEVEENESGNTIISCDSSMDISGVEALFHQLEDALEAGHAVEIHAQDVDRIDTSAVQLLVAFVKEAEQLELEVIWKGISEGMQSTFRNVGVLDLLKVPESAYL